MFGFLSSLSAKDSALLKELRGLSARLAEDRMYELVLSEIENDSFDPIARARAFEEADGNKDMAIARYIKHRVRRLNDLNSEYQIWLDQKAELERTERTRFEKEQLESHNTELEKARVAELIRKGGPFGTEVTYAYRTEFEAFYADWIKVDYAHKFMNKTYAWEAFLKARDHI